MTKYKEKLRKEEEVREKLLSSFEAEIKSKKLKTKAEKQKLFQTKYEKKYVASAIKSQKIINSEYNSIGGRLTKAIQKNDLKRLKSKA